MSRSSLGLQSTPPNCAVHDTVETAFRGLDNSIRKEVKAELKPNSSLVTKKLVWLTRAVGLLNVDGLAIKRMKMACRIHDKDVPNKANVMEKFSVGCKFAGVATADLKSLTRSKERDNVNDPDSHSMFYER